MNASLLEVMAGITDQVIEDVNANKPEAFKGAFQLRLAPTYQPETQSLSYVTFLIEASFISFAMNLLPISGMLLVHSNLEKHEPQLFQLTYSMGLKHVSWLLAVLIVVSIGTFFYGSILCLVVGLMNLSSSSFSIVVITVLAFVYATVF